MKVCPKCDETYHDDALNFCLMDGTPLVAGETQPTVVIGPSRPTEVSKPKRSALFWASISVAALATLVGALFGGIFLYFLLTADGNQAANRNRGTKASPTPKATIKNPSPLPDSTTEDPSPKVEASPRDIYEQEPGEITPIVWETPAATFKQDIGRTYTFECPEKGVASAVWGSDIYTTDSSICTAAVHVGVITLEDGGQVVIEFRPGRPIYGSTSRNGITSYNFGAYDRSFVVRSPTQKN